MLSGIEKTHCAKADIFAKSYAQLRLLLVKKLILYHGNNNKIRALPSSTTGMQSLKVENCLKMNKAVECLVSSD